MGNFKREKASTGNGFVPPEADFHNAIVAGLVDFGMVETEWDGQKKENHKIGILYYLETEIPESDGKRYVQSVSYNFSYNNKSTMYKHLSAGFGADFANNVDDLESELLGKQVRVLIDHVQKKDGSGIYAKVDSLRPAKTGVDVSMDGFEIPNWINEANTRGEIEAIATFAD